MSLLGGSWDLAVAYDGAYNNKYGAPNWPSMNSLASISRDTGGGRDTDVFCPKFVDRLNPTRSCVINQPECTQSL